MIATKANSFHPSQSFDEAPTDDPCNRVGEQRTGRDHPNALMLQCLVHTLSQMVHPKLQLRSTGVLPKGLVDRSLAEWILGLCNRYLVSRASYHIGDRELFPG